MAAASSFNGFSSVAKFSQSVTINPSAVPAASVATETFTVPGVNPAFMLPLITAPDLEAGLTIIQVRITAVDTIELTIQNNTGGSINAASQQMYLVCL